MRILLLLKETTASRFAGAPLRTHEGAPAVPIRAEAQLRRAVPACMLWEDQFYEDGATIAERIAALVPRVKAAKVAALAIEAREQMKLRHAPLLLVRETARYATHRALVAEMLARAIQRADELAEFLAIYWKDGRQPLSAQVKKGLAAAFGKFEAGDGGTGAPLAPAHRRRAAFAGNVGGSPLA